MQPAFNMYGLPEEQLPPAPLLMPLQAGQQAAVDPMQQMVALSQSHSVSQKAPSGVSYSPSYGQQFDDAFRQSMGLRKEQLEALKKKLAAAEGNKPTGLAALNLRPFAAFADQLTGYHTAQNAGEPVEVARSITERQRLQDAVEKGSNALSDDQLNYLKLKAQEEVLKARDANENKRQGRTDLNNEFKLRNEWDGDPITKNTKVINEGFGRIEAGYRSNDPADYLTMIFGLMKMQDPASAVKEGEFKNGQNIGGWPEQWKAAYMQAKGQGNITQAQKDSIMHQARGLYQAQMAQQQKVDQSYEQLANRYGYNAGNVVLKDIFKRDKAAGKPTPGEVIEGHKYIGGNPADPKSWQAVK